jgi:SAM-dependent methyltransferase
MAAGGAVCPTKVLTRFLASLATRPQPLLLDLGKPIGSNVTFFGERLGCKILVEDLAADLDRHVQDEKVESLPAFLGARLQHEPESVDGILCWDVFDYLEKPAAQVLAAQLTRILKPGGVLLALFNTAQPQPGVRPTHTRHVIVDEGRLEYRPYPAACTRQRPLLNRDIQRMFEPLRITDQFLLQTNMREVLFRKPADGVPVSSPGEAA